MMLEMALMPGTLMVFVNILAFLLDFLHLALHHRVFLSDRLRGENLLLDRRSLVINFIGLLN